MFGTSATLLLHWTKYLRLFYVKIKKVQNLAVIILKQTYRHFSLIDSIGTYLYRYPACILYAYEIRQR